MLTQNRAAAIYSRRPACYRSISCALRGNKLPAQRELGGYEYQLPECLEKHLPRLLDRGCTAVICSHDILAHMLLIHCAELNISVPGQLSVIGFDDLPLCQYTMPPLSTVRQNRTELGKSAFYALSSQMGQTPVSTLLLHAELIERGSSGPAPDN